MYRALRRVLFLVAPERIHTWVFAFVRGVTAVLPLRRVLTRCLAPRDPL
ncbi:MAG TPA: dihydroorotate dehydrogenase (quinone), partial [Mycobacterium sp.]|nr:dihydroorotate dehydrogenase (quinone) [Mycobacterium sp.]